MAGLKPPGPLSLEGNIAQNWKHWNRAFTLNETATTKTQAIRCATFLHVAGPAAQQIYETFQFAREERNKLEPLKAKFKAYCEPEEKSHSDKICF